MKVLLATGGSGGHIFPAFQTALELKRRGHEVVFVGALALAQDKLKAAGFTVHNIDAHGFQNRSLVGVMRFGTSMVRSFKQSRAIVKHFSPDKIAGFGGYSSFPVLLAGRKSGRPIMIHEQNVLPGKANRLLAKLADKVAISFKESEDYFDPAKIVWTGCPCNDKVPTRSREEIYASFGLRPGVKTIALLGGSQGSKRLNEIFFEAMQILVHRGNIQAVHMTGRSEYEMYAAKYKDANLPVHVSAFVSPVEELYAITDMMVARCGASTVFELAAFSVPSLLVPYPFAGNHQKYNGQVLARAGAAVLIEQKNMDVDVMIKSIERINGQEFSRQRVTEKTEGLFLKASAQRLADAVEAL